MTLKEYKNRFSKYPADVQEYMENVYNCLVEDYGKLQESWLVSLDLIASNYDILLKAKADIDANGLLRVDEHGRTFKNQNVAIYSTAQSLLVNLLKGFALQPVIRSKMRQLEQNDVLETEDEYIDSLTK